MEYESRQSRKLSVEAKLTISSALIGFAGFCCFVYSCDIGRTLQLNEIANRILARTLTMKEVSFLSGVGLTSLGVLSGFSSILVDRLSEKS